MLTREEILAMGTRLKTEVVEVPEWGGAVTVTELTSRERDAWEQSVMEMDLETEEVTSKADNARAKLILRTVIDEEGNRMFRDTDLDMLGNRIAAITFGPTHVVILVGRNKIVPDLEAAFDRIRNYVSPAHLRRISTLMGFELENPCMKTASCQNCKSPMRICNAWSIIEKSYPQGRIRVVLINEDLGV